MDIFTDFIAELFSGLVQELVAGIKGSRTTRIILAVVAALAAGAMLVLLYLLITGA